MFKYSSLLFLLWPVLAAAQDSPKSSSAPVAATPDVPAALPARPTVSSPAGLPPVGYLQFEQGFLQAADSPGVSQQFSIPQNTKIALTTRLLAQVTSEPFAHTSLTPSGTTNDTGDLVPGVQFVFFQPSAQAAAQPASQPTRTPTIAIGYNGRVRSGTAPDLDTGSYHQGALLLLSQDIFGFHYDANFLLNEQTDGSSRRAQLGQTLSVSHPIHGSLSGGVELWHFTEPFIHADRNGTFVARANAVGLLGNVAYTLRPNLVFDAGAERGLTSTSTAYEGFAGFTYLLPHRLFKPRSSR